MTGLACLHCTLLEKQAAERGKCTPIHVDFDWPIYIPWLFTINCAKLCIHRNFGRVPRGALVPVQQCRIRQEYGEYWRMRNQYLPGPFSSPRLYWGPGHEASLPRSSTRGVTNSSNSMLSVLFTPSPRFWSTVGVVNCHVITVHVRCVTLPEGNSDIYMYMHAATSEMPASGFGVCCKIFAVLTVHRNYWYIWMRNVQW